MTVVSCIIASGCTTHASDSLLTRTKADGETEELEWEDPKLVRVEQFGGVIGFYGFAGMTPERSTLRWLRGQVSKASECKNAQEFAARLARKCEEWLRAEGAPRDRRGGIGMHFTAYEWWDGYWVPELFHVRNWADPHYASVKPEGVVWTRDTYGIIVGADEETRDASAAGRARVREHLVNGGYFRFNNGDPEMYNGIANAVHDGGVLVFRRVAGERATLQPAHWASLCLRPVEIVADLQRDFAGAGRRRVGGRPHDVTVTPPREFVSRSGVT